MGQRVKLAIVSTHPIQYQAPLWRALARRAELDVTVLYAAGDGAERYFDRQLGREIRWDVPLLAGYRWRVLENRPLPWLNWRFRYRCPAIERELAAGGYGALLLVGKEYWYYLRALAAARRLGMKTLYRAETPPPRQGIAGAVADVQRRHLFRGIDCFLCTGRRQRDFYRRYGAADDRLFWSPYGVDNDFFARARAQWRPRRAETRRRWNLPEKAKVVAFVGKFIRKKRPLDLIRAFERLDRREEYGLLMAGTGELLDSCREYAVSRGIANVAFAGFMNQGEIGAVYAAADCLVLPSDSGETWGLVVNEAMNFGLPIIVSDEVGCSGDLVEPGANGFIHPLGDVAALSGCIARVFADDAKRAAMGARSEKLVSAYSLPAATHGALEALGVAAGTAGVDAPAETELAPAGLI